MDKCAIKLGKHKFIEKAEQQDLQTVTIFGSTGSIGTSTLCLVEQHPEKYQVHCLTANDNVDLLIKQAKQFSPQFVVIFNETHFPKLKEALSTYPIICAAGQNGLMEAASQRADIFVASIVGFAGLAPTLKAIKHGTRIALANKECLVAAGDYFMQEANKYGALILPVDSEHSGVFQALNGHSKKDIVKVTLTASGGPFRCLDQKDFKNITVAQALKHPNWSMGSKITIDSATLMNKGLELIEAAFLFGLSSGQLDAIIHPQSIVHALISFLDGSCLSQLSLPDMVSPISYALAWPNRVRTNVADLNLEEIGSLEFEPVDHDKFPSIRLSRQCLDQGVKACCALNSINEIAVQKFLNQEIQFIDIFSLLEKELDKFSSDVSGQFNSLEEIIAFDNHIRAKAQIF